MRGAFVHIGTNIGMRSACPIFADGRFKYIPIPESYPSDESWTYEKLGLTEYVRSDWRYAHYDPEFISFTWGDFINRRTYVVRKLGGNDFVFFISTLQYKGVEAPLLSWIDPNWAYYIIGYFELQSPVPFLKNETYPVRNEIRANFENNAHVRRDPMKNPKPFCLFKGTQRSKILEPFPVPISRKNEPNDLAKAVLPSLNAERPRWWSNSIIEESGVQRVFQEIRLQNQGA